MEILISMTVLMIGLLPMLAVFQVALRNLNRSIEDTYASAIAQSVVDSIRLGLHEMKVDHRPGGVAFFIFDHDGTTVQDSSGKTQLEQDRAGMLKNMDITQPAAVAALLPREYCIMLPDETSPEPSPSGGTPLGRAYLYPRQTPGSGPPKLDYVTQKASGVTGRKAKVTKTYQLGQKLSKSTNIAEQSDTLSQYSFAFTMRVAKAPSPTAPIADAKGQSMLSGLYEVVVTIYRRFNADPSSPKNDTVGGPGREFITYIAE
jgi:hypothetical protein